MKLLYWGSFLFLFSAASLYPQGKAVPDSLLLKASLNDCINYALKNQPSIRQSVLNEEIADEQIKGKLADWFPQLNFNYNFQHNYKLPTSIFQGNAVHFGVVNTSSGQFSLTQTIFNKDVLLASSTAHEVRAEAQETTTERKIGLVVNVSKAYYGVLLAQQQINLIDEDITRLKQSYKDAFLQYKSGTVDKTDYERASIALNNAEAEKIRDEETLKSNYAALKDLMGYPVNNELKLQYDTSRMENEIFIDTTQDVNYENRIEYQIEQTQLRLQKANLNYYNWSFLPSVSAFGNYNFTFQNNELSKLYNQSYPSEYVGVQLSFPIFEGGKRIREIDQASLEVKRSEYDLDLLKSSISLEYARSMANYKSSLSNFNAAKQNRGLAKDVYKTIDLQYKSGVKSYLDVITAETDLRTTEANYFNSLFQLLSSKLDVEKALGTVKY